MQRTHARASEGSGPGRGHAREPAIAAAMHSARGACMDGGTPPPAHARTHSIDRSSELIAAQNCCCLGLAAPAAHSAYGFTDWVTEGDASRDEPHVGAHDAIGLHRTRGGLRWHGSVHLPAACCGRDAGDQSGKSEDFSGA
jgi:hypothetical protein